MIAQLAKWARANQIVKKTYPHSIWDRNMCVLVAETYGDIVFALRDYLNAAYGADKYQMEFKNKTFIVSSRNGRIHFKDLVYKDRNEVSN